jgi:hypothetical protein
MVRERSIAKTPREHFMRTVDEELAKFERKERAFQQADRDERAARLRFPLARENLPSMQKQERK